MLIDLKPEKIWGTLTAIMKDLNKTVLELRGTRETLDWDMGCMGSKLDKLWYLFLLSLGYTDMEISFLNSVLNSYMIF